MWPPREYGYYCLSGAHVPVTGVRLSIEMDTNEYLTIIPQARVGYEMVDSQRGA